MCRPENMKEIIAVTNRKLCSRPFLQQIERVCIMKPKALILREKDLTESDYERLAEEVSAICSHYEIPLIYHSFAEAAKRSGAKGIHLSMGKFRKLHCQFPVTGVSIHSVEEAKEAEKLGASYLTAGHIYATDCKKGIPARGTVFLQNVCQSVRIPVYAIGGIRLCKEQIEEVLGCGARGACIMSEMMKA